MIKHLTCIAFIFVAIAPVETVHDARIYVAPGKYGNYYHLWFRLTPDNCELTVPISERMPKYGGSNEYEFVEGGQFEVFIRKKAFPIPVADYRHNFIILRMPWTSGTDTNATRSIAEKRKVFDRIQKMKLTKKGAVDVSVELLTEYISIKKNTPLMLELEEPNVWFRTAYGRYIDYLGPLKREDCPVTAPPIESMRNRKTISSP